MSKTRRFLLAVAFAAMTFILSCSDDSGNSNVGTCGGKEYDITIYSCERGELVGSCRGVSYYPAYEYCENGVVKDGAEISSSSSSLGGQGGGSSSSGGGGSNLSHLPKQVYLVEWDKDNFNKEIYNGNGNIIILPRKHADHDCNGNGDCECTDDDGNVFSCREEDKYDTLQAGNIQNGQMVLNLPNIDGKYLFNKSRFSKLFSECHDDNNDDWSCETNVVIPSNLMIAHFEDEETKVIIPGKSNCELWLWLGLSLTGERIGEAALEYASVSGRVTGTRTETYTYSGQTDPGQTDNLNLNYSQGWNLIYYFYHGSDRNVQYWVTDPTGLPTGSTLEWWLSCDDELSPQTAGDIP